MVKYFDIDECSISASKHFVLKYMKSWNWDFHDLRDAIKNSYKIEKVGKEKYEVYTRKDGSKKIICIYWNEDEQLFVISGSKGD